MSNLQTKNEFAKLEIDGKTYQLAYDFNAIAEAERVAGCNLLHGVASLLLHDMTAGQVRGLLYAALRQAHPKMTIEDAGALATIDTIPDIREALLKAYDAALPEGKKIFTDPTKADAKDEVPNVA